MTPSAVLYLLLAVTLVQAGEPHEAANQASDRHAASPEACPSTVSKIAAYLNELKTAQSRSKRIPVSSLKFGITVEASRQVYLWGYSKDDFAKAHIDAQECLPNLFRLKSHTEPFFIKREEMEGCFTPGEGIFCSKVKHPLLSTVPLPLYYLDADSKLPANLGFKEEERWLILARMLVHELIHLHELPRALPSMLGHLPDREGKTLAACLKDEKWLNEVDYEMRIWREIDFGWARLSQDDLKNKVMTILNHRTMEPPDSQPAICWRWVEGMELLEGVTNYFEIELNRQTKYARGYDWMWKKPFSLKDATWLEDSSGFPYYTGAQLCRVLEKLDPSRRWQDRLYESSLEEEVRKRL